CGASQIPSLRGREMQDHNARMCAAVAVVNEVFSKKYFANEDPVGRRFGLADGGLADIEIIGVTKAARYNSLKGDIPPVVYVPYSQNVRNLAGMTFEVRTLGDPLKLVNTVGEVVHRADPRVPIARVNTQSRQIDQTINQERTLAQLGAYFAVLALFISAVGLYGTTAYNVARRSGEISIRMALGAERRRVMLMVLR